MKIPTLKTDWSELDYERAARALCLQIMTHEQHLVFQKIWVSEFLPLEDIEELKKSGELDELGQDFKSGDE